MSETGVLPGTTAESNLEGAGRDNARTAEDLR